MKHKKLFQRKYTRRIFVANNKKKKKSPAEVNAYKNFIKSGDQTSQDTAEIYNANLIGSDQLEENRNSPAEEPAFHRGVVLRKFLKRHIFEVFISILCSAFLALLGWYGATLIQAKIDIAILDVEIEAISVQVDSLSVDAVTKEILELQLEALKQQISGTLGINNAEIAARLDLIEQQLTYITKNYSAEND